MNHTRTIAAVTGTRAEYGLLRPVMKAIAAHASLELRVVVAGAHLIGSSRTIDEVAAEFAIAAEIPMQADGMGGRMDDANALGRGVAAFAQWLAANPPDVVLVLGDRIEAFAAAAAASVAGIRVAHMHGGDRAEGIADDALRHAITKLAHIHLPATQTSAMRIIAMGEQPERVHMVGSPAMDGLADIAPQSDSDFSALGSPQIIVLLHPVGDDDKIEHDRAAELIRIARSYGRTLILHPNRDPGRDGIMRAIRESGCEHRAHLPRDRFVGLLRRAKVIVGNSSAGLIECAAIPIRCINIGRRQNGREKPSNVTDIANRDYQTISTSIGEALDSTPLSAVNHPYGCGDTGSRTAELLATIDLGVHCVRKFNTY